MFKVNMGCAHPANLSALRKPYPALAVQLQRCVLPRRSRRTKPRLPRDEHGIFDGPPSGARQGLEGRRRAIGVEDCASAADCSHAGMPLSEPTASAGTISSRRGTRPCGEAEGRMAKLAAKAGRFARESCCGTAARRTARFEGGCPGRGALQPGGKLATNCHAHLVEHGAGALDRAGAVEGGAAASGARLGLRCGAGGPLERAVLRPKRG